jgi:beta-glucosidase-like glycosyl hydrolase
VADRWPVEETVRESLLAGADAFLACRDAAVQQKAEEALDRAATDDPVARARLAEAAARMRAFRATLAPRPASGWRALPLDAHAALAARMRNTGG